VPVDGVPGAVAAMLLLKLVLVPGFVWLRWLASRRWGPAIAGWLAGLPIVAGPIQFIIAVENGPDFALAAASGALASVLATVTFIATCANGARRSAWPAAQALAATLVVLAGSRRWLAGR